MKLIRINGKIWELTKLWYDSEELLAKSEKVGIKMDGYAYCHKCDKRLREQEQQIKSLQDSVKKLNDTLGGVV